MADRGWRDDWDEGFALVTARRRRAARPLLAAALAGCRAEQDEPGSSELARLDDLITESRILAALIACHDADPGLDDLDVVVALLVGAVDVLERLAAAPHLEGVARHGAHGSMLALTDVVQRRRARLDTEVERLDLGEASAGVFDRLVPMLARLGRPGTALVAAERARARVLVDLISGRDAAGPIPAVDALTASGIRAAVAGYGATVVVYWLTADAGQAWVVTPAGRTAHVTLPAGATRVDALLGDLHTGPELDAGVLAALSEVLIAPLPEAVLPEPGEPLTVVPHRGLHAVPFAALPYDGAPLVARWPLASLPSIGTAVAAGLTVPAPHECGEPSRTARMLALLAPSMPVGAGLLPLPGLQGAAPVFERLFPPGTTMTLRGEDATLGALVRHAPAHDVLLLGTHGQVDAHDPELTFLALAPDRAGHDGRARIGELARIRLDARLAVLLACSSAGGPITGDGVLGLSRAFLLAGARSLVSPLWEVGELTAAEIAHHMLRAWVRDGLGPAAALRSAQLELHPDQPRVWAGFVLSGAWR